jgi:hypothetical protein
MTRRKSKRGPIPREQRLVQLHYWLLDSDAFLELHGNAVKLLLRLRMRFNGSNNGKISMSTREAAREVNCSHNHAAKCFHLLQDAGFIRVTQKGAFSWKKRHATTWRLTWLECDGDPATKEFMRADRGRRKLINGCLVDLTPATTKKNSGLTRWDCQ